LNKESNNVDTLIDKNLAQSANSHFNFNSNYNINPNNYNNPYMQKNIENANTDNKFYYSANDFNKNITNNYAINMEYNLENPISQVNLDQGGLKMNEIPNDIFFNNNNNLNVISDANVKNKYDLNQDNTLDKYKMEIDQIIKEAMEKAGLPYQSASKNDITEPLTSNKLYNSSRPIYDTNPSNIEISNPAYKNLSKSKPEIPKDIPDYPVKKVEKIELPNYESIHQRDIILNDSEYPNNINAVVTDDMTANNNLYNNHLTFKDNLSNNGNVNLYDTNKSKEINYNTNLTFENLKSEENTKKKESAPSIIPAKSEEKQVEKLNSSSKIEFNNSENLLTNNETTKKPEISNQNLKSIATTNLKKNEEFTFSSNKQPKIPESVRESMKAKNKIKENLGKNEDYLNTKTSITNFPKEFLSDEDNKNLQFELANTYSKELCWEQINIITMYINIGKVLTNMVAGILNNVNPVNRMEAFRLLITNIYDWPNDESYFNGVICFLPTANQKEATDTIKRMNRSNCCCTIF
jgi:hypothetical protein